MNGKNNPATLTLVQETSDPVADSASSYEFGAVDSSLTVGDSWGMNATNTGGTGQSVYANATASCYGPSLVS